MTQAIQPLELLRPKNNLLSKVSTNPGATSPLAYTAPLAAAPDRFERAAQPAAPRFGRVEYLSSNEAGPYMRTLREKAEGVSSDSQVPIEGWQDAFSPAESSSIHPDRFKRQTGIYPDVADPRTTAMVLPHPGGGAWVIRNDYGEGGSRDFDTAMGLLEAKMPQVSRALQYYWMSHPESELHTAKGHTGYLYPPQSEPMGNFIGAFVDRVKHHVIAPYKEQLERFEQADHSERLRLLESEFPMVDPKAYEAQRNADLDRRRQSNIDFYAGWDDARLDANELTRKRGGLTDRETVPVDNLMAKNWLPNLLWAYEMTKYPAMELREQLYDEVLQTQSENQGLVDSVNALRKMANDRRNRGNAEFIRAYNQDYPKTPIAVGAYDRPDPTPRTLPLAIPEFNRGLHESDDRYSHAQIMAGKLYSEYRISREAGMTLPDYDLRKGPIQFSTKLPEGIKPDFDEAAYLARRQATSGQGSKVSAGADVQLET